MSAKQNGSESAHPIVVAESFTPVRSCGLTKREAFALAALQGLSANGAFVTSLGVFVEGGGEVRKTIAMTAVAIADATLIALDLPVLP